ncbi:MAG: sigma-70 family RNA polymerase sigma factor [Sphingobacteriales bacterium]|jgi:RNA polymerase sigma factor (sigma-70 family)|nr:sigma-70 family RNA polymerase sigma factor [Sphingobacteriales bacterium]
MNGYFVSLSMVNEQVYFELYRNCRADFLRWSTFSYNLSSEDARDLYQETFLRIWDNLQKGKLQAFSSSGRTYVFAVGKHVVLDFLSKQQRLVPHSDLSALEQGEDLLQDQHNSDHTSHVIQSGLNQLEQRERSLIELFYFKRLDMHSIAEQLGYKNADVAKKRKYEVFRKLCNLVNSRIKSPVS